MTGLAPRSGDRTGRALRRGLTWLSHTHLAGRLAGGAGGRRSKANPCRRRASVPAPGPCPLSPSARPAEPHPPVPAGGAQGFAGTPWTPGKSGEGPLFPGLPAWGVPYSHRGGGGNGQWGGPRTLPTASGSELGWGPPKTRSGRKSSSSETAAPAQPPLAAHSSRIQRQEGASQRPVLTESPHVLGQPKTRGSREHQHSLLCIPDPTALC